MNKSIRIDKSPVADSQGRSSLKIPSYLIELAYFGILVYANLGPAYGLAIPLVGAGSLAGLAVLSILHFGTATLGAFRPIRVALGCGISVLLIQAILFQESFRDGQMRTFVTWILSLIVIHSLSLRKKTSATRNSKGVTA